MVSLYIQLIHKSWHRALCSESSQPTSKKPEVDLEPTDNTNFSQTEITEAIRNIQQVYHLERRLFV